MKPPRVPEWYAGRTLLITGGTGFMGKVLIEKLLWSCPEVERILVLVRPKRGSDPRLRIQQMTQLPLFERLRTKHPKRFAKVTAIEGDITESDLGLSETDRKQIVDNVSVVFHCAASLRLEAGLKAAVLNNTLPTLRLLELAQQMPQLKVFLHLSTAFCHCDLEFVGEQTYPSHPTPHEVIALMSWMQDRDIEEITPRLLGSHPNCYTYSKNLAETLVDEARNKIPVAIVRPSIVLPTLREPIPGWVDTLNGPIGLMVGAGKGVIRSMMAGEDFNAEMIPVDIAINGLITVAWTVGTDSFAERPKGVPVYNITQGSVLPITYGEILAMGRKTVNECPFEGAVWYPDGGIRTSRFWHTLCVIFLHFLPAYFIDFIMILIRQKRFMVRVQHRISVGLGVLQYFTMRQWCFSNAVFTTVGESLGKEDKEIFYMKNAAEGVDIDLYMKDCMLGARQYCMKEPLSSLPRARRHLKMLYWLDRTTACLLYALGGWLLFQAIMWMTTLAVSWQIHLPMLRPGVLLNPLAAIQKI